MTDERPPRRRNADFLNHVSLSETADRAVGRMIDAAPKGVPLQTGALLASLAEADVQGEWGRIWPSYEGGADALLAASDDTRPKDSGVSWYGALLSQDLLSALRLLASMAEKYEMDLVQPGAVVLALAANPDSGAARRLGELSGSSHSELLERIQSDLLDTTLDGFDELTQRWAVRETLAGRVPSRRRHLLIRQAAAVYCVWVAWLAIRAGAGEVIGSFIVAIAIFASAIAGMTSLLSGPSSSHETRQWKIELRPRYATPGFMFALFLICLGAVLAISRRHHVPNLLTPTLFVLGCFLAVVLAMATFHVERLAPKASAASSMRALPPENFKYRTLFGTSAVLAGIIGLFAWYAHLGLVSLVPEAPGARLSWSARVLFWMRRAFSTAYLGKSFEHAYWPLLVIAAIAVGCYFSGLAAQLLLIRVRRKAGLWAAGSCAAGLFIVSVSYLPVASSQTSAASSHGRTINSALRYDEGVINQQRDRCRAFEPAPRGCPFSVVQTSDGQDEALYAIALTATAGDSCAGAIVYFFDGDVLITDTTRLPPGGTPAEAGLSSPNPGQFTVAWRVNPSADAPCAQFGTGGTDNYLYTWNGRTIVLAAGTPPQSPKAFPPGSSLHPAVPDYLAGLEYCGTVYINADRSGTPIFCLDGRPSLAADQYLRSFHLAVLNLGHRATVREVEAATCSDVHRTSIAIASDGMQLAAAEQEWSYGALNLGEICGRSRATVVTTTPSVRNGWAAAELPVRTIQVAGASIACGTADNCAAVGNFYDPSTIQANSLGVGLSPVLLGYGSSWLKAEPVVWPGPDASLMSVACPSTMWCVAVGSVSSGADTPGLLMIRSGPSLTAMAAPFPPGVVPAGVSDLLSDVACATPSFCVAVGENSGSTRGFLVTEHDQKWTAIQAPLPPGTRATRFLNLYSVACPRIAECIAVGTYFDASGHQQGLLEYSTGSSWKAMRAPVPVDAAANPGVTLQALACPSAARCLAVGNYTDSSGHSEGLLESGFGSRWAPAKTPLPSNASVGPGVGLDAVSCPATSSCVVLGNYQDSSGNFQGLLLSQMGSSWTAAEVPLPTNTATPANPTLTDLACPAVSHCVAIGVYTDTSGDVQGFVATERGSSWGAAETPVPAGSDTNPNVMLSALACPAVFNCVVLGQYTDSSRQTYGLILTSIHLVLNTLSSDAATANSPVYLPGGAEP